MGMAHEAVQLDARIEITGSVEAEGEGTAFWIQRQDPATGQEGFVLVLTFEAGGDHHLIDFGFLAGTRPDPGTHSVLSIDEVLEEVEAEGPRQGVMASYLSGDFTSWQEVSDLMADPAMDFEAFRSRTTGMGTGVGGEVDVSGWSGDRMDGRLFASMLLITEDGRELPFELTASFGAGPGPLE